ncbi:MAG: hypothetical protein KC431_10155 [Myxococcales bacterium]|nr:hypothetical protein [Myxococcales bacterium]
MTWRDFDEFWRELESSHEETPYTFDAYDEEVARIAFKAGRESMRRQLTALLEHMIEQRGGGPTELGRAILRELADDVEEMVRVEEN